MSVTSRPRPRPRPPPQKSLKLKTLLSKVVRYTIRVTKIHPESCYRCHRRCRRCCCRCMPLSLHAAATATAVVAACRCHRQNQCISGRGEAELRMYNLKKTSPPQSRSQAVVCVSTPRKYPRSGYFLVFYMNLWIMIKKSIFTHLTSIARSLHCCQFWYLKERLIWFLLWDTHLAKGLRNDF